MIPRNQIFFEVFWRMRYQQDFFQKIFTDFLLKVFSRNILWRFWIEIFFTQNLHKICIHFFEMILITFLSKIFLRSLNDLEFNSFGNLRTIFGSNLFAIFCRSSSNIFSGNFMTFEKFLVKFKYGQILLKIFV